MGVQPTRLRALRQGTPTARCIILQVTMQQSSRVFFYSRVYPALSSDLVEQEQKKYKPQPTENTPRDDQTSYVLYDSLV